MSCRPSYYEIYPNLRDGRYDAEFPYRDCSKQLEEIASSVKMISCIAYYKSYIVPLEAQVTVEKMKTEGIQKYATKEIISNHTASGTATVLFSSPTQVLLVTCAHVVSFPETLLTYHYDTQRQKTVYLRTLSVKERQSNYVVGIAGVKQVDILAQDIQRDVAFVGVKYSGGFAVPSIRYPFGRANELEWGNFVYLFGYPAGQCILTKGIVSNPRKDRYGSFFIDAVVNRGFSGGPVFAIRDGVPNFELVGIVRLVVGREEYHLTPAPDGVAIEYAPDVPYIGDIYVEKRLNVEYGVTLVIPSETILTVFENSKDHIRAFGYDVGSLIQRELERKEKDGERDTSRVNNQ